jgi:hypothetical protein
VQDINGAHAAAMAAVDIDLNTLNYNGIGSGMIPSNQLNKNSKLATNKKQ